MFQPTNIYNLPFYNPQQPTKLGSLLKTYKVERIREDGHYGFCSLKSILAMLEYKGTSTEEIRSEDYELNRKPTTSFYNVSFNNLPPLERQQQISFDPNWYAANTQAQTFMQNTANAWNNSNNYNEPQNPINNMAPTNTAYPTIAQNNFTHSSPWNTFNNAYTQAPANPWIAPATTPLNPWNSQPDTTTQPANFPLQNSEVPLLQTNQQQPIPTSEFSNQNHPFPSQTANTGNFEIPKEQLIYQQPDQIYDPPTTFDNTQIPSFQNTINIDPYFVSQIKFETSVSKEIPLRKLLAKEFFEAEKEESEIKLEIKEDDAKDKEKNLLKDTQNIYSIPSTEELKDMTIVKNLKLCIGNKAYINYIEDIESGDVILEHKIELAKPFVYMADKKGEGLNKHAKVTINEFWPFFRGKLIRTNVSKYPEKEVVDRFVYELKNDGFLSFVSYDIDTGCYVYEVHDFETN